MQQFLDLTTLSRDPWESPSSTDSVLNPGDTDLGVPGPVPSDLVSASSLEWNLENNLTMLLQSDAAQDTWRSPSFDPTYPDSHTEAGDFIWEMVYEFSFDRPEGCDFIAMGFPAAHNSPSKGAFPSVVVIPPAPVDWVVDDRFSDDGETVLVAAGTTYPDNNPLSYSAAGLPADLSIGFSTGLITGTIDRSASQGGIASDGVYTVQVCASDGAVTTCTSFTWTVNNPAPIAAANTGGVTEDIQLSDSGNVIIDNDGAGVDFDPDGDDLLVSEIDGEGNPSTDVAGQYGSLDWGNDGSYSYTLDNTHEALRVLDAGETINDVFSYTLSDGQRGIDTASLTITITGVNEGVVNSPPVDWVVVDRFSYDGETVLVAAGTTYPDNNPLSYSAMGLPADLSIGFSTGLITGTIDRSASQGGIASDGVYTVQVCASDGAATTCTSFIWTVNNPAPIATANTGGVTEDIQLTDSGNVIIDNDGAGTDSDPDGDALLVLEITGGLHGGLVWASDGSYSYTLDNSDPAVQALNAGETINDVFSYILSDGQGGIDTASLTITITGVNEGVVNSPPDTWVVVDRFSDDGETVLVAAGTTDPDNNPLSYSATGLPAGVSINSNGVIEGTIGSSASQGGIASDGVYTVQVCASDGAATTCTSFTWTVNNPAPIATANTGG